MPTSENCVCSNELFLVQKTSIFKALNSQMESFYETLTSKYSQRGKQVNKNIFMCYPPQILVKCQTGHAHVSKFYVLKWGIFFKKD